MDKFLVTIICFSIILQSNAQNKQYKPFSRCQTMEAVHHQIEKSKTYRNYHHSVYNLKSYKKVERPPLEPVVVPVAFHFSADVISCNQESCLINEVEDQLLYLNQAFGDNSNNGLTQNCSAAYEDANGNSVVSTGTNISFCYATPPSGNAQGLDPVCDLPVTIGAFNGGNFATNGTGAPGWDNILNIFITSGDCLGVADGIPGRAIADGVTVCAAAFGGINGTTCNLGIDPIFNEGKTLVHEIGHYLGLFHTFEGGCNDEPDSAGPYNVNDTPALELETTGCAVGCPTSCGGQTATANFMDYSDDACMGLFSKDQAIVMNYWANTLFGDFQFSCNDNQTLSSLYTVCNSGSCIITCPSVVNTALNVVEEYCGVAENLVFPNPKTNGLSLNADSNGEVFKWTINNYANQGGTFVNQPSNLSTSNCTVATQTYYLNIECKDNPTSPILNGGIYKVQVFPTPPSNLNTLIQVTNENSCSEPVINPINGCDNYISVTPFNSNPSFPVNQVLNGIANYTVNFIPNPNGPNCCDIPTLDGEILENGDFEKGAVGWTEIEELPPGTPSSNPYGVIGISATSSANVNGTTDAWFGGFGVNTLSAIEQNIDIPACNTLSISFDYKTSGCNNSNDIIFSVIINNTTIFTLNCDERTNGGVNTHGPIDIPITNAGSGSIRFQALERGTNPPSNFSIDNISLKAKNCPAAASCSKQITANYNCSGQSACSPSQNLNGNANISQFVKVENNINSTAIINANVTYQAGQLISLNNGFCANKNFDFIAKIENCN